MGAQFRDTSWSDSDDAVCGNRCFDGAMLTAKRAAELAAKLQLDVYETGICLPCLSIVAFPLDRGDEPKTRGATVSMTPNLWEEGLELPARLALEQARARGVKDAELALADVEQAGARTTIARAIVRVLALQLVAEMRAPLN
jgi:hypothetical protein